MVEGMQIQLAHSITSAEADTNQSAQTHVEGSQLIDRHKQRFAFICMVHEQRLLLQSWLGT